MGTPANQRIPGATYRLQFNRDFTFKQATQVVEYLHELGITDCYASPLFRAGAQSTHGYDICGFDQLNPNLGSREEFDQFSGRLRELGMGLVLDIVPNHMGNDVSNRWWRSVLEKGRASPYGTWFDIDWQPPQAEVRDKVVLPILEDHYAKVLEAGKLRLVFEGGEFAVAYYDRRLPLSPESYALVLKRLPLMEDPKRALAAAVENFNGTPGMPRSFDKLHGLLEQQHYRLVYWRAGPEAINYRRFFDVTELVSLRMELPEVFEAAHALVFELVQAGQVTGLRVDHPDGLWNPRQYFERLQASAGARLSSAAAAPKAPVGSEPFKVAEERSAAAAWHSRAPGGRGSLYVVAEKILTGEEELPVDWAVEGTTGYDFLNRVNGLFVDSAHGQAMERCYAEFIGERSPGLRAMVRSSKRQVLETSLVGELNGLASRLKAIAGKTRYGQDFTCQQIRECLAEVIAALPVYRTYITEESSEPAAAERGYLLEAIRKVRSLGDGSGANAARGDEAGSCRTRRKEAHDDSDEGRQKRLLTSSPTVGGVGVDAEVLGFLERLLLLRFPEDLNENGRQLAFGFIMRFQQVTGPVMAKGLEDTAFYRYNRLISLNEVGGDPDRFGVTLQEFHEYNSARAESWPHSLLATATHDTKRGEDARARLDVLSEMPAEWERAVTRWRKLNAGRKTMVAGRAAPQANDEYLLYQTLVGAWEGDGRGTPAPAGGDACPTFVERIAQYMLKAVREAKVMTSWSVPNGAYEGAMRAFVERVLASSPTNPFLEEFVAFARRVAFFGRFNSLSQVLLKLTSPGVPDLYQGTELWDLSLVDPDNRRVVDYERRRRMLREVKEQWSGAQASRFQALQQLLQEIHTGRIKLYLMWRALEFRREQSELFQRGVYAPLLATGERQEHVCAFARVLGREAAVTVAPRLVLRLTHGAERPPLGTENWGDTALPLPEAVPGRRWLNVLTGETLPGGEAPEARTLRLGEVLGRFPVALLKNA